MGSGDAESCVGDLDGLLQQMKGSGQYWMSLLFLWLLTWRGEP